MLSLSCIVGLAAIALGSAGGVSARATPRPPARGAGVFMKMVVSEKLSRRYDLAWETLYPRHQQVASRDAFVDCESRIPWPGADSSSVRVLRVFRERIWVAGESRALDTTAVDVRATGVASGLPVPFIVEKIFHALRVRGQWKWILSPAQYAYYNSGTCPYA